MTGTEEGKQVRGFRVEGRVQGVGFRWWTRKTAQRLGLVGRVRNEVDGSVSVRVAGLPDRLDALETALREGPAAARVEVVRRQDDELSGDEEAWDTWDGFEIER